VARYSERSGIGDNWTFCLAFSFFRLAAILQGVYKRSLDGNASNPERAREYRQGGAGTGGDGERRDVRKGLTMADFRNGWSS
jgi:hypothetical protein